MHSIKCCHLVLTLIFILYRAEVRALLCLSILFSIFDHVICCCIAICFMLVLANNVNNKKIIIGVNLVKNIVRARVTASGALL